MDFEATKLKTSCSFVMSEIPDPVTQNLIPEKGYPKKLCLPKESQ